MSYCVSVIIPTYNSADTVGLAVQSVLAQTHPPTQVLVVDDGSTDRTAEVLAPWQGRINYLHRPHEGKPAALNDALRRATADFVAFLDADDVWEPWKLETQLAFFRTTPSLDACFTNYSTFGAPLEVKDPFTRASFLALPTLELGGGRRLLIGQSLFIDFLPPSPIPCRMSTVLVRRACLERVGPFDATLHSCQDLQMFSRLARFCQWGFLTTQLVRRRVHSTSLSHSLSRAAAASYQLRALAGIHRWIALTRSERRAVMSKYTAIAFSTGYHYFRLGDTHQARVFFRLALRAGWSPRLLGLIACTFLPRSSVRGVRRILSRDPHGAPSGVTPS